MTERNQFPRLFTQAVDWVLHREGVESDDPRDRGGHTRYGISARAHPDLDIPNLTRNQAVAVYFRDYWQAGACASLPPVVGLCLFDGLIQHRPKTARRLIQQALGVTPDGLFGPVTRQAAKLADPDAFLVQYLSHRAQLYRDLSLQPSQADFFRGWLVRLFSLQQFIQETTERA